jgi:hypothetical protein
MTKHKAVATTPLLNARGEEVPMEPGPCIWCGQWVESGREAAGCTNPFDPAWHVDGDYGCGDSPETNDDGTGDHARPYDLALTLLKSQNK